MSDASGAGYWARLNPFDAVGMPGAVPASARTSTVPGIGRSTVTSGKDWDDRLYSSKNPLFWFGALLAVTIGLISTSTSIKVGPFQAAATVGK